MPENASPTHADADRVVRVGGQLLRCRVRPGDPGRTPVLLCNGIGASFEVLQPLVDALDPAIPVVRFDVPGAGESPPATLPRTFFQIARLAAGLMSELGHGDRFDVVGFSWGGALAQQLAWQYPRRVRRLVILASGTGLLMVPGRPGVLVKMLSPRRFHDPAYAVAMAAHLYGGSARDRRPAVRRIFRDLERGGSRRGYLHQLLAGSVWTSLPWLPTLRQPTLVVSGDDDPIIPVANARLMTALIPRARLHVYRGGHIEPVLAPDRIVPVISDFLMEES